MSTTELETQQSPVQAGDVIAASGGRRERRLAAEASQKPTRLAPSRSTAALAPSSAPSRAPAIALDEAATTVERTPISVSWGSTAWVLGTVSLLCLWFVVYAVVLTPFQESSRQTVLYSTLRQQLSQQVAPLGPTIAPGAPVALVNAPALGILDTVVVEGTSSGDLMSGPGHKRDTVLPGQAGVSVLYGRASLFGGPFSGIRDAHAGDAITVITGQGTFSYTVSGVRRAGDPFPQPLVAGAGRLTLVTAEGEGRAGSLSPDGVVYVDATLQGESQPTAGHTSGVPVAEQALQGDPSALLPLAILLPLLIAALLLVVWARSRWGGWQTWIVGAPLVLATLWGVSQCVVQLLPNLV